MPRVSVPNALLCVLMVCLGAAAWVQWVYTESVTEWWTRASRLDWDNHDAWQTALEDLRATYGVVSTLCKTIITMAAVAWLLTMQRVATDREQHPHAEFCTRCSRARD